MDASQAQSMIPRLMAGIDITKAGLSMEEGMLVSRIDGVTNVANIALLLGKTPEATIKIIDRLANAGIVQFGDQVAAPPTNSTDS